MRSIIVIDSSRLEMRCSFMQNNKNYHNIFKNTVKNLDISQGKPKLLLHVCCGPCSTIPLKLIKDYFDVTLLFNNSNIYPKEEHDRRYAELNRYIDEEGYEYPIIFIDYDNESYNKDLQPYSDLPEGHERCRVCFKKRLTQLFEIAEEKHFDYCGTVMSISRYKSAKDLNSIGEALQQEHPSVKWLYADFKKEDGYEKSLLIIKEHEMYFQEYCGCIYSYKKWLEKKDNQ